MAALSLVVILTTLVSFLRSTSATSILLPLYVYPGDSAVNWSPLFDALSAHPSVNFIIIINPGNGPIAVSGPYPDSSYIAGISKLHSYQNALVIGYVHTTYGQAPLATLESNITIYANWSNFNGANIAMQGIFFDEAPASNDSADLQYMSSAAAFARNAIPGAYVVYNPGVPTSDAYFSPVPPDLIVEFENDVSAWQGNTTVDGFAKGEVGRSAVLVHGVSSASEAASIVSQCVAEGVGAVDAVINYSDLSYIGDVASALDS